MLYLSYFIEAMHMSIIVEGLISRCTPRCANSLIYELVTQWGWLDSCFIWIRWVFSYSRTSLFERSFNCDWYAGYYFYISIMSFENIWKYSNWWMASGIIFHFFILVWFVIISRFSCWFSAKDHDVRKTKPGHRQYCYNMAKTIHVWTRTMDDCTKPWSTFCSIIFMMVLIFGKTIHPLLVTRVSFF